MVYKFKGKFWEWGGEVTWHFISVPLKYFEEIKEVTGSGLRKGFGSVRVEVTIGSSVWTTSIFPSKEAATYILPIKKSIIQSENFTDGDTVDISIKLIEL